MYLKALSLLIFSRLTLSSAFQKLHTKSWGKTEFMSLKQLSFEAKMLCNPWLVGAATTKSETGWENWTWAFLSAMRRMIRPQPDTFCSLGLCWMFTEALSFVADDLNTGLCGLEVFFCLIWKVWQIVQSLLLQFIPASYPSSTGTVKLPASITVSQI